MSNILVFDTQKEGYGLEPPKPTKIANFKLIENQHPVLREVLPEFDFTNPPVNPNEFASALVETCKTENGLGLSANQCGFKHRVFVMGAKEQYVAFFNPKIIWQSEEKVKMMEGCLSFPLLALSIERPETIEAEYQDFNGVKRVVKLNGLSARCFQHELDHMNGILYTSRIGSVSLKMAMDKKKKIMRMMKAKNGNTR
jgi:peptide deformylase